MSKKGGGGSSVPQIDPNALVQKQAETNRISQFTPQGNLIFGNINGSGQFNPSTGQAASVVEESPFQQRYRSGGEDLALTGQQIAAGRIQNLPTANIDTSSLPAMRSTYDWSKISRVPTMDDFSADADRLEKSTYDRAMGMLNPEFDKQNRRIEVSLANKGIPISGEAYNSSYESLRRSQNEAMNKAALDAVAAGRTEQGRLFGQALTSHNAGLADQNAENVLANSSRAQGLQEMQALRSSNLQEIGAMLGLNPVSPVEAKNFFAPSPVDVTGPYQLSQQAAIANNQLQSQQQNGFLQGLFGLGSAGLSAAMRPGATGGAA